MTNFSYKDFILTDPAPANPLWKLAAAAVVVVASVILAANAANAENK